MKKSLIAVSAVVAAGFAGLAQAESAIIIRATMGSQTGFIEIDMADGVDDNGVMVWSVADTDIYSSGGGDMLGTIDFLTLSIGDLGRSGSQIFNLDFSVAAGALNTTFEIDAAPIAFAAFGNAAGLASAEVSLTDSAFSDAGAEFAANGAGAYTALYNGGGTVFGDLFASPITANRNTGPATVTVGEATGGGVFSAIPGSVSDIQAEWNFSLSAFDLAAGTSTFIVTPTPAGAALIGLGGLACLRRRR